MLFVLFINRFFLQTSCLTIAHIFNKNWLITLYTDHQYYKDNIIVEAIGMQEGKKLWKHKEGTGSLEHPSVIFPFLGVVVEMLRKTRCLSCFVFFTVIICFLVISWKSLQHMYVKPHLTTQLIINSCYHTFLCYSAHIYCLYKRLPNWRL